MKKNKGVKLILALAVLVILLVVYLLLQRWNQAQEAKEDETEETEAQVMAVSADEIAELTVENENGTLVFSYSDEEWAYEDDADFPLDQDTMVSAAENLEDVTASRTLEDAQEPSEYGLDDPSIKVTVTTTDDEEMTLFIGNVNNSTGDYYAMVDGTDTIYTIGSGVASAFGGSLYDFIEADDFPTITSTDIDGMAVEQEDGSLWFTYESAGWTVSDGSREEDADSTKMDELTSAAASLSYDEYIDYNAEDLSQYGLDNPTATITINYTVTETVESDDEDETEDETGDETEEETEAETETVDVAYQAILEIGSQVPIETEEEEETEAVSGDETEETETETETEEPTIYYYVKLSGSNAVHTISEDTMNTFLELAYADCVDSYVSNVPITGMSSVKVTYDSQTYELTYESETTTETDEDGEETTSTEYTYYVDGKEATSTLYTQFCNAAAAMQTQSRMEEAEAVSDAALVLEYELTDGSTLTVEYSEYENGVYLVTATDRRPGLVSKLDVEDLISYFEELISE